MGNKMANEKIDRPLLPTVLSDTTGEITKYANSSIYEDDFVNSVVDMVSVLAARIDNADCGRDLRGG